MTTKTLRRILAVCFVAQFAGLLLYGYLLVVLVFAKNLRISWFLYEITEVVAFLALLIGCCISVYLFFKLQAKTEQLESKLDVASSRFHDVITDQFQAWGFTDAESEIGMLMIKGMSISEIAELRGRSQATVKAQNSSIYQKSGMNNRAQLVSYFVEELTSGF